MQVNYHYFMVTLVWEEAFLKGTVQRKCGSFYILMICNYFDNTPKLFFIKIQLWAGVLWVFMVLIRWCTLPSNTMLHPSGSFKEKKLVKSTLPWDFFKMCVRSGPNLDIVVSNRYFKIEILIVINEKVQGNFFVEPLTLGHLNIQDNESSFRLESLICLSVCINFMHKCYKSIFKKSKNLNDSRHSLTPPSTLVLNIYRVEWTAGYVGEGEKLMP